MSNGQGQHVDHTSLPRTEAERRRLADELKGRAEEAFRRGELVSATLFATDAILVFPNDRALLDVFDEIVLSTQDPLSLVPVATGAVHVATAAGRARILMMQKRLPEAIELLGRVLEVAPELGYLDWVRRWLQPHIVPTLGWDLVMEAVVKPTLTMAIGVPVPPHPDDPRLPNVRSGAEIFDALIQVFADQKILWFGAAAMRRRLGDAAATLAAADEGVRRFPQDWGMRTALLNALRDAKRPDEALAQARVAMQLDPSDLSALHDAAWGFLDADRAGDAANLFQELVQRDPNYPGAAACMHYARFRAWRTEDDRRALVTLRERRWWDDRVRGFADEVDPPVQYVTVLPGPGDATANYARDLVSELGEVMRCCGRGASLSVTLDSQWLESPSVNVAFDAAMRGVGASGAVMTVEAARVQSPDPRADKGSVHFPVWSYASGAPQPVYAQPLDPRAQHAVASVASQLFRREVWDPAAQQIAAQAGPQAAHAFVSVMTNPPPPPPEFDGLTWTYRCQIAAAVILSHMGPWDSGPGRAALYSLVSGPNDWVTIAGVVAFAWRASDHPNVRAEVLGVFQWLRGFVAAEGFTPWEHALAASWLALGGHSDQVRADLEGWLARYDETVASKNAVRSVRRYGGLTLEQYARFCAERDAIPGIVSYGGPAAAMAAAFNPPPALAQLCQQYGVAPHYPYVSEWQEALNASGPLMEEFLETKRRFEFERMGVTADEKGALDQILDGNMDMHLRMAQGQQAQRQLNEGGGGDPDPVVFPGQAVARLSDYVRILKGMQAGNMMGALGQYGLDMMTYGQVAQAWGAKLAADPVLTEKFSRMMQG